MPRRASARSAQAATRARTPDRAVELAALLAAERSRNAELERALAERDRQQTATTAVLRAISRSATDLQEVLDGIAASAARLTGSSNATIFRLNGNVPVFAAAFRAGRTGWTADDASVPAPRALDRGWPAGRAMVDGRTVHTPDLAAELDEYPGMRPVLEQLGFRSLLSVPLLGDGAAIGAIAVERTEPEPFSSQQVALLEAFADEAV